MNFTVVSMETDERTDLTPEDVGGLSLNWGMGITRDHPTCQTCQEQMDELSKDASLRGRGCVEAGSFFWDPTFLQVYHLVMPT